MLDIFPELDRWIADGRRVAIAMVVNTWGSSPRGVGAKMAVTDKREMAGSVSGGCVEGAVVETALQVIQQGGSSYLHFGVADETAWEVGLACGGEIDVLVHPLDQDLYERQKGAMQNQKVFGVLTQFSIKNNMPLLQAVCVEGQEEGCFEGADFPASVLDLAVEQFRGQKTGLLEGNEGLDPDMRYFLDVQHPQPRLVIVGGAHISMALVRLGNAMGYRTIVIDPRRAFGNEARFSEADQLVQAWPDAALKQIDINRSTAIAVLSHDPKLDDPALIAALNTNAFYIGALGSTGTQRKRRQRLLEAGLPESQIDRIHGPIGLKLGGRSPEEIALAVMAEIVKVRHT